ncbi:RluA family pseudouridine synthase [Verrucomicrobiota bacterium]
MTINNINNKALGNTRYLPKGLLILHEDRDLLVIHKPEKLLSISTGRREGKHNRQKTAYSALTDYVKKGAAKSRNRIFIVHRLDKDTSGVMLFAKNFKAKSFMQDNWDKTTKKYLAIVHGELKEKERTLSSYLTENKELRVYATGNRNKGKLAQTKYKVIKATKKYSLLDIELITGRKNQIRVQMADAGHPVMGDRKYGRKKNHNDTKGNKTVNSRYMALHSYKLICIHPYNGKQMTFTSPPPPIFSSLPGLKIDLDF